MSIRPKPRISWAETNSIELDNYEKLVNFIAALLNNPMPSEHLIRWQIGYEYAKALDLKNQFIDIAHMVILEKKLQRQCVFNHLNSPFVANYQQFRHPLSNDAKFIILANVMSEITHAFSSDTKDEIYDQFQSLVREPEEKFVKLSRGITGHSKTLIDAMPWWEWALKHCKHKDPGDAEFFGQPMGDNATFFPM